MKNKPIFGLAWFVVIAGIIWIATAKSPRGHNPHPTPNPSPSPSPSATPPNVTLAWDAAADQTDSASGYYFKLGFVSGQENQITDVGNMLTRTVQLTSGTTYFFVVTAYDANRNESQPSNEIVYTAP